MIKIEVRDGKHFLEVYRFAQRTEQLAKLQAELAYFMLLAALDEDAMLKKYGEEIARECICKVVISPDFAPYSFFWQESVELPEMYPAEEEYKSSGEFTTIPWRADTSQPDNKQEARVISGIHGGLIYHGPHDGFGDGGSPSFSVSLSKSQGWSIHT